MYAFMNYDPCNDSQGRSSSQLASQVVSRSSSRSSSLNTTIGGGRKFRNNKKKVSMSPPSTDSKSVQRQSKRRRPDSLNKVLPKTKKRKTGSGRRRCGKVKFGCNSCTMNFSSFEELKTHSVSHKRRILKCIACDEKFRFYINRREHYRIHEMEQLKKYV